MHTHTPRESDDTYDSRMREDIDRQAATLCPSEINLHTQGLARLVDALSEGL